jgi:two-component system, response regulator PdtaR
MLTGQTVLIVEEEFLIALDLQRVLESLNAKRTVFARSVPEALGLAPNWADFALAVVEFSQHDPSVLALLTGMRDAGISLVLTASDSTLRRGVPAMPDAPVVIKPFLEEDLASAVQKALAIDHSE